MKSNKIEVTILSMECVCGKKFKGIDEKKLKRRMNGHTANCKSMRFLKRISKIPEFKNKPLIKVLKELGLTK